jgi:light-regulated signal transduction histidine kinase (bacteriophytochrome)
MQTPCTVRVRPSSNHNISFSFVRHTETRQAQYVHFHAVNPSFSLGILPRSLLLPYLGNPQCIHFSPHRTPDPSRSACSHFPTVCVCHVTSSNSAQISDGITHLSSVREGNTCRAFQSAQYCVLRDGSVCRRDT